MPADAVGEALRWRNHGPFVFRGVEGMPLEVGEVVLMRVAEALPPPEASSSALRVAPRDEAVVGDRYRIDVELGRGSTAVVYSAYDTRLGRQCAVKLLLAGKATPHLRRRFQREAVLGARVGDHPGVVSCFDLGTWPETGELYLALDLVVGVSLRDRMRAGDLPRAEGLRLVLEVAKAVAHCHQRGVIHRDLKPSNVLIDASGQARLTDLGVAKALGEAGELTATGQRVGTPSYMAPEQIADAKAAGKAVDVYGLGGLLYAVLTGQPPYFRTGSWRATLVAVLRGEFPPPRELDPTVGEALNGLCCRCLAVDPKARPESVVAFVAELSGISE